MSRTPVPDGLIHRPEEVKRNAERFDNLCRLAEEVAYPVVQEALDREYRETAATGAEVLTDEAKQTLETLAEEAALLEDLDKNRVLEEVQRSLSEAIPPPDEEECRQHAREFSQVLMSAWLETLRAAQSKAHVLLLSDWLLPEPHSGRVTSFVESIKDCFGAARPKLPEILIEAIGWSAVNEDDTAKVMSTLRRKLFPEPCLVDLPFDLAMIGAPWLPVLASTRSFFDEISRDPITRPEPPIPVPGPVPGFATEPARNAVVYLSEPLARTQYGSMAMAASASLRTKSIATQVQHELNTN